MAGQIKKMIDTIIAKRSQGNPTIVLTTITKLTLKGIDPTRFTSSSDDDPAMIQKVKTVAAELGVAL